MSVSVPDSPTQNLTPSTRQAQAALETVHRAIATCTLCVEAGFIALSLPIFHGHAGQRLMSVGQTPGPSAGERPLTYSFFTGCGQHRDLHSFPSGRSSVPGG